MKNNNQPIIEVSFCQPERPKGIWVSRIKFEKGLSVGHWEGTTEEEARAKAEERYPGLVAWYRKSQEEIELNREREQKRPINWWARFLKFLKMNE